MKPIDLIRKMGGPVVVARALGLRSHTGVYTWRVIPARHILTLESQFGIPREVLRPDLYRPEAALPNGAVSNYQEAV